jgi:hypothetical protein
VSNTRFNCTAYVWLTGIENWGMRGT